jgi:hypothetical protein
MVAANPDIARGLDAEIQVRSPFPYLFLPLDSFSSFNQPLGIYSSLLII